ncbi:hypothetical protein HF086_012222 [Spodoptera exigua]|uniref:Arf-GAP domain-containing protein n=1 Tax=Spodoptera exigua TaxID=7107 RepID=A0A922MDW0_SPOEX|nr:hypothetical protein HF086_012222 [Spodoptera exigua]
MIISRSKHRSSVEVCADCGASDPSWASINRGLLLCAECCSVHRSMGRHISHVKSLRQGSWPPSLLAMVQALTAQNVNCIWEHSLLDTSAPKHLRKKPQPKDPLHPVKSEFILAKHLRLAYVLRARRDEPPSELGRQLHSAVRSSSLDTAMRLLAQGADPNYYNQEKGTTCLHVACRAGQPAQAELLVAWGAEPTARDHSGNMPADCARQGGHTELADRMTELVYEATDRMIYFLTGEKPDHASGRHYIVPRAHDTHEMTDVAKAARGKLQLLPNHLFEELVMDIYDEIDRRETEATPTTLMNPLLSASHLKHFSQMSDDEPLYDSVASDEDYAALAPIDLDLSSVVPRAGETVSSTYNPSLPLEHSSIDMRRTQSPSNFAHAAIPEQNTEIETLKKEIHTKDSTITELKNQLKSLQTIVEQLTKENSVLKTTSSVDDDQSMTSQISINDSSSNALEPSKAQERGKSLETEHFSRPEEVDGKLSLKPAQRPVSMYETREGPKNNWQVTKHQLTTLSSLERSLSPEEAAGAGAGGAALPAAELVQRRAECVTRAISELWAAARDQHPRLQQRADSIRHAVRALLALFPQQCEEEPAVWQMVCELRAACSEVSLACAAPCALNEVRAAAYDLAKATKLLVTHFQPHS